MGCPMDIFFFKVIYGLGYPMDILKKLKVVLGVARRVMKRESRDSLF